MTTLNIEGRKVKVSDDFLSLPPAEQQATVEEIARSLNLAPKPPEAAQDQPAAPEPEGKGLFRRADDFMRGVADMATFGTADEIAASLNSGSLFGLNEGLWGNYDEALAKERGQDAAGGWDRFAGQVGGALLIPGGAAKTVGGAALAGAGVGGAYGFGSGEGGLSERAKNAAVGAFAGGAAGAAVRGGLNALQNRAAAKTIPDIPQLRRAAEAGYKAADDAGVMVKPDGIRRIGTSVVGDLVDMGYHPNLQPKIGAVLSEIERLGNTNSTYKGLGVLRRMVGNVAASNDPTERAMAMRIMNRLDDYMNNIPADDVIMGDAARASRGFRQGQENWARMRRAEMVDTAAVKAERRAASSGTGGNLENTLRQNVRGILDNPRRSRGMTPAEIEMAEKVVRGTPTQNAMRMVGKLSPTTGGLQAALNVGATAVNPLMAIPGLVGIGAKSAAEAMTTRNVNRLSQIIRSGGRTAQELAKLARNEQITIPAVRRLEGLAKLFGVSLPTLAAATADQLAKAVAR